MKKMYNLIILIIALLSNIKSEAQVQQELTAISEYGYKANGELNRKDSFLYKNKLSLPTTQTTYNSQDFFNPSHLFFNLTTPSIGCNQERWADTTFQYHDDMSIKKRIAYTKFNSKYKPTLGKQFDFFTEVEKSSFTSTYHPGDTVFKLQYAEQPDDAGDIIKYWYGQNAKGNWDTMSYKRNGITQMKFKVKYLSDFTKVRYYYLVNCNSTGTPEDSLYVGRKYNAAGKAEFDTLREYKIAMGNWYLYKTNLLNYKYNDEGYLDSVYKIFVNPDFLDPLIEETLAFQNNSNGKQIQAKHFKRVPMSSDYQLYRYYSASYSDDKLMNYKQYNTTTGEVTDHILHSYDASGRAIKYVRLYLGDTNFISETQFNSYGNITKHTIKNFSSDTARKIIINYYYKNIPTSIDNLWAQDKITLYPNPASNVVQIQNQFTTEDIELSVYDINGKMIQNNTLQTGNNTIDISHISAGIYLFQFNDKTNNRSTIERVSIHH